MADSSAATAPPGAFVPGASGATPAGPVHFYDTGAHHPENGTLLGFWIYLMSDSLVFASLFATYGVLGRNYAAGPSGAEIFELPLVAINTSLLLLSSITYGFAVIAMNRRRVGAVLMWLAITGLFGCGFVGIELHEFSNLIHEGNGPQRSAFLSAFFTLVGTHGLHVSVGIIWLVTLIAQVAKRGLVGANRRRVMCLSMFWHFLDVVWIGVFTFVYLMGVLP
jgi:cytochrome o ubiquinol oxidase subunit 3